MYEETHWRDARDVLYVPTQGRGSAHYDLSYTSRGALDEFAKLSGNVATDRDRLQMDSSSSELSTIGLHAYLGMLAAENCFTSVHYYFTTFDIKRNKNNRQTLM